MRPKPKYICLAITAIVAQIGLSQSPAPMQVRHFTSTYMNAKIIMTNDGTISGADPEGRMCVNIYAFTFNEELFSCCTCKVTPNGLMSLKVGSDIDNTLTPFAPIYLTVMLVSSKPVKGVCNPGAVKQEDLTPGLHAWGTQLRPMTINGRNQRVITEMPFSKAQLSASQFNKLIAYCGFIQANGSGYGICGTCKPGVD